MKLLQKNKNSLHSRVNDHLRDKPLTYASEETEATIEIIFDQLQKAEEKLQTARKRVDRLR